MRTKLIALSILLTACAKTTQAPAPATAPATPAAAPAAEPAIRIPARDPDVAALVGQLDLEKYKATIKGLTQFGDRRQGTKRNRDAVDWIEAQLKSYGCTNTERITYEYNPPPRNAGGGGGGGANPAAGRAPDPNAVPNQGPGGSRMRGNRARTGVNNDSLAQTDPRLRALNAEPTTPGQRQEVVGSPGTELEFAL